MAKYDCLSACLLSFFVLIEGKTFSQEPSVSHRTYSSQCILPEKLNGTTYTLQDDPNSAIIARRKQDWAPEGSVLIYTCEEGFSFPVMTDFDRRSVCVWGKWTKTQECIPNGQYIGIQMNTSGYSVSQTITSFQHDTSESSSEEEGNTPVFTDWMSIMMSSLGAHLSSSVSSNGFKVKTSASGQRGKNDTTVVSSSEDQGVAIMPSSPYNTSVSSTTAPSAPVPDIILKLVANLSDEFPSPFPHPPVCGASSVTGRIINGSPSKRGDWPWMVMYGYKQRSPRNITLPLVFLCGGSLITDRHTITAGHCIVVGGGRKMVLARLGVVDLYDKDAVDVKTLRRIVHPGYLIDDKRTNDLAIVTLKSAVTFSAYIKPICLPFPDDMRKGKFGSGRPSVSGWGRTEDGRSSQMLKGAQLDLVDHHQCQLEFSGLKNGKGSPIILDEKAHLCAVGEDGQDSCQGDSGGPLMQPWNYHYFLIGIISFGYQCGTRGLPGVHVRVTSYLDWIANVTLADARSFNSSSPKS